MHDLLRLKNRYIVSIRHIAILYLNKKLENYKVLKALIHLNV